MADVVVNLRDKSPLQRGEPNPEVVAFLEKYLALAKSGEIMAVGIAVVSPGEITGTSWVLPGPWMPHLIAATGLLGHRLIESWNGE